MELDLRPGDDGEQELGAKTQELLLDALNRLLDDHRLADDLLAIYLPQRSFTVHLLHRKSPSERRLLNRLLLEDAFPSELERIDVSVNDIAVYLNEFVGGLLSVILLAISLIVAACLKTLSGLSSLLVKEQHQLGLWRVSSDTVLAGHRESLRALIDQNVRGLEDLAHFGRLASLFSHHSVGGDVWQEAGTTFTLVARESWALSVHSEVLYYTMMSTILHDYRDRIKTLDRSHILVPGSPS